MNQFFCFAFKNTTYFLHTRTTKIIKSNLNNSDDSIEEYVKRIFFSFVSSLIFHYFLFYFCLFIGRKVLTTYHNSYLINELNTTPSCMVIFTILIESLLFDCGMCFFSVSFAASLVSFSDYSTNYSVLSSNERKRWWLLLIAPISLSVIFMIKKSDFFNFLFFSLRCLGVCWLVFVLFFCFIFLLKSLEYLRTLMIFQCKVLVFHLQSILHCESINHGCKFQFGTSGNEK